jgi:tyrosyl-tRNA synthetase
LFRILDRENVEVRRQSEWYGQFTLEHVFRLTAGATVAQLLAREDFRIRFEAGHPLAVVELLYPLLQAQDSVEVRADVELGGLDQKFNLLLGRDLQAARGQPPQQLVMVPLLVGTDMFGKVMSLPDGAIAEYAELVTDLPADDLRQIRRDLDVGTVNPRDLKRRLGREIVAQFHGAEAAGAADDRFMEQFSRRSLPAGMPAVPFSPEWFNRPVSLVDLLVAAGLAGSKSGARRLVVGGGISLDGQKHADPAVPVTVQPGAVLQVGRRRFARLMST